MKTKALLLGFFLTFSLTVGAWAQFGPSVRTSELLGSAIKDPQNQKVGTVKDLVLDLENGRIVTVIVGQGSYFSLNNKLVMSPPDNFALGPEGKTLRLINIDKSRLQGAPAIEMSHWKENLDQSRVEEDYNYFGIVPYFLVQEHPAHSLPVMRHMGDLELAGHLTGTKTLNRENQDIGRVANFVVSFPEGRLVEAIIDTSRFLNMKGELSAVPPQALHFDAGRSALAIDATRESLMSAPHFASGSWPVMDREQATAVYQAYHVIPYFLPVGESNTVQAGPAINNQVAPSQQEASPADLEITAKIQKDILGTDGLSVEARAVKVTTINGHVTLRGTVANPQEKRILGEIAARFVPAANVDNELEVKINSASAAN